MTVIPMHHNIDGQSITKMVGDSTQEDLYLTDRALIESLYGNCIYLTAFGLVWAEALPALEIDRMLKVEQEFCRSSSRGW